MIIGITGYAGVGKDEFAKSLKLRGRFEVMAFSDPLHEMAMVLDPILIVESGGMFVTYSDLYVQFGYTEAKRKFPQFRRFLQILGTDAVRNILGEDTWVRVAARKIDTHNMEGRHTAITGVRYPNEAAMVKAFGGIMLRIEREGYRPVNNHTSDTSVDDIAVDRVIYNNGSLRELSAQAQTLLNELGIV